MLVTGELSLSALILIHEPFVIFPFPFSNEEWGVRAALLSTWHTAKVNHKDLQETQDISIFCYSVLW